MGLCCCKCINEIDEDVLYDDRESSVVGNATPIVTRPVSTRQPVSSISTTRQTGYTHDAGRSLVPERIRKSNGAKPIHSITEPTSFQSIGGLDFQSHHAGRPPIPKPNEVGINTFVAQPEPARSFDTKASDSNLFESFGRTSQAGGGKTSIAKPVSNSSLRRLIVETVALKEGFLESLMKQMSVPHRPYIPPNHSYILEVPSQKCQQFVLKSFINLKFMSTYAITNIQRIWNPFLMTQYYLMKSHLGKKFEEHHLFHGTNMQSAHLIMTYNFDWRKVQNFKFGRGLSFANNPWYASHYSLMKSKNGKYIMLFAKVLVENGELCHGSTDTLVPIAGSTTTSSSQEVVVKYDDGTFYPEFLVTFEKII